MTLTYENKRILFNGTIRSMKHPSAPTVLVVITSVTYVTDEQLGTTFLEVEFGFVDPLVSDVVLYLIGDNRTETLHVTPVANSTVVVNEVLEDFVFPAVYRYGAVVGEVGESLGGGEVEEETRTERPPLAFASAPVIAPVEAGADRIYISSTDQGRYYMSQPAVPNRTDTGPIVYTLMRVGVATPVNTAVPVLSAASGTLGKIGVAISSTTGTWSPTPTEFEYRGTRDGAPISGATSNTYTPVAADDQTAFRMEVRARVAPGDWSAWTASASQAITYTAAVAAGGLADQSYVAGSGVHTVNAAADFTGAIGGGWSVSGSGATIDAAGLVSIDASATGVVIAVPVTVSYVSSGGATLSTFDLTVTAPVSLPVNTALPSMSGLASGVALIGSSITRVAGTWSAADSVAFNWQIGGFDVAAPAGVASVYVPSTDDDLTSLRLRETATNVSGSTTVFSAAAGIVQPVPTMAGAAITPTSALVGETLTVSYTATGAGDDVITWKRNGVPIPSSDEVIHVPQLSGDFTAEVVRTNSGGSASDITDVAAVVSTPVAPVLATVSIAPASGAENTVFTAQYTFATIGNPAPTVSFQWNRNGAVLPGATNQQKTAVAADVDQALTVRATASNGVGAPSSIESAAVVVAGSGAPDIATLSPFVVVVNTGIQTKNIRALTANNANTVYELDPYVSGEPLPGLTVPAGIGGSLDVDRWLGGAYTAVALTGPDAIFTVGTDPIGGISDNDLPAGYSLQNIGGHIYIVIAASAVIEDPGRVYKLWPYSALAAVSTDITITVEDVSAATDISIDSDVPDTVTVNHLTDVPGMTDLAVLAGDTDLLVSSASAVGETRDLFYRVKTPAGPWVRVAGITLPYTITPLVNGTVYEIDTGDGDLIEGTPVASATAPAAFTVGMWSVADKTTGGALTVTVGSVPSDGGSAITAINRRVNAGAWSASGITAPGTFDITGLTDGVSVTVELQAVNAVGAGTDSDDKSATPTAPPTLTNLLTNGSFTVDANWTENAPWAINIGTGTLDRTVAASTTSATQSVTLTPNVPYETVMQVVSRSAGAVRVRFTGGTAVNGTLRTAVGTYTEQLIPLSGNNLFNISSDSGSGGFTGSVDNVALYATAASGVNLATNGAFAADTNWTKDPGWSIASGVTTIAEAGTTQRNMSQAVTLTPFRFHKITVTITARTNGTMMVQFTGGAQATTLANLPASTGTHTVYVDSQDHTTFRFRNTGAACNMSLDNLSIEEMEPV